VQALKCVILLAISFSAHALDPDRDIHQFAHRSWGEREGYPRRAQALAQTVDGFLWIGSDAGLFRFDGVHFERYSPTSGGPLPDEMVRSLLALPDGSLWIAYSRGEICLVRHGEVKIFGASDGVTSEPINLVQDHEGTIWANTWAGILRFNGKRWEHIAKDWNFPEVVPHATSEALFVDSHGTLWAGVNNTVLYLKEGSRRFEPTGVFAGFSWSIAEAPDGKLWLADNYSFVRVISMSVSSQSAATARCEVGLFREAPARCPSDNSPVLKVTTANKLFFDRKGSLWIGTDSSGLVRVPHPDRLKVRGATTSNVTFESFTSKDGLSSDNSNPVLEDREGNIWVATRDGLDQFRDTALVPVELPKSIIQIAIAPADDGDLWIAGSWSQLGRTHGEWREVSLARADAYKPYRDSAGVSWLMGDSLWRWQDGRFQKVAKSPDGLAASFGTWQVADDESGRLWAFATGHGFFSLDHDEWHRWPTPPAVAKLGVATMFSDSTGRIWVSSYEGHVVTMYKGNIDTYPVWPDRPLRSVKAFAEHNPQQIWAGGSGGLALIDNGRFRLVRPTVMDSFEDVVGVVDAGRQGLWLAAAEGIFHISADEVNRVVRDPSYRVQWVRLDTTAGLAGQPENVFPFPKAVQGTDGRIWFATTRGVAWIDPNRQMTRNSIPPPVSITSVIANDASHTPLAGLKLPAHTLDVGINYTALSLSVPERVQFRYKLEGSDRDWQDAGPRRVAFYTNLSPRHYRFRVIACNEDGVWNGVGAEVDFTIAPAWYQTLWFSVACAGAFLVLVYAMYQLRLRQIAREQNAQREVQTILAHANRLAAMGQVTASIAHEVNQPISGTVINAQVAQMILGGNAPDLDKINQALNRIVRDGKRAGEIVQRVRTMTKKAPASQEVVALNDAIAEVVDMTRWQAVKNDVAVRTELAQDLPAVRGDRVQLQQIVLNLSINAIEAMSEMTDAMRELVIRTAVGVEGDVLVSVADSGPGLRPAAFNKLFEPFYTTKPEGLGLGLSICRTIAEAHGGRFSARPNIPRGTVFEFSMPAMHQAPQ